MEKTRRPLVRAATLLTGFIALLVVHGLLVAPWMAGWGATPEERRRPLPGDEIVPKAAGQETRAITIEAPASRVWPWLAQIGQDRAGFYSYRILENLAGCQMPDGDRLHPELQAWTKGDRLWMYPPDRAGGIGYAVLSAVEPGRALAFGNWLVGTSQAMPPTASWSFVHEPLDGPRTRLLVRGRGTARPVLWRAFDRFVFEPMHFVMERRMMINLKRRAEGAPNTAAADTLEVATWTAVLALCLASVLAVFRRRAWRIAVAVFLCAAAVFAFLTLAQPGPGVGALLAAAVAVALWWSAAPDRLGSMANAAAR